MTDHANDRFGRCEMELLDGRVIELTGLTVDQVVALLRDLAISPSDVRETRHYVSLKR